MTIDNKLIDAKEASMRLGISVEELNKHALAGNIPSLDGKFYSYDIQRITPKRLQELNSSFGMDAVIPAIPPAAQELLKAIAQCDQEIVWKDGTYLHPKGKIVFQGLVTPGDKRPDGSKWIGEKPMYLIVYNHPRNEPGMCDGHWFEVDVVTVTSQVLPEELPPAQIQAEVLTEQNNRLLVLDQVEI